VADGSITPGEYGRGFDVTFNDDANHGRLYSSSKSRTKTPEDLSVQIHLAHTDRNLFLAFRVRDQFIDSDETDASVPERNDSIEVFINGDHVANDFTPHTVPYERSLKLGGNREGFELIADVTGHQDTVAHDFTNADWRAKSSRTPDGYIIEFEIPLTLIDTRDGPEFAPAKCGSELLVNFAFIDNDDSPTSGQMDYGIFCAEDPNLSPFLGGEDFWTVSLRLTPTPALAR
jgi:hypothetical protein